MFRVVFCLEQLFDCFKLVLILVIDGFRPGASPISKSNPQSDFQIKSCDSILAFVLKFLFSAPDSYESKGDIFAHAPN